MMIVGVLDGTSLLLKIRAINLKIMLVASLVS